MGYTAYWTPKSLQPNEIPERFWDEAEQVLGKIISKGVVLANGNGTKVITDPKQIVDREHGTIIFNGFGDLSHETFGLEFAGDWNFCKTVRKPYDIAVKCILLLAQKHGLLEPEKPGDTGWSWDGDEKDTEYINAYNLMLELELI